MQEKEDDLALRGIPSRWNEPLTTSDIREKEVKRHQCQNTRDTPKGGIPPKHNLSSATKKQSGTGKPSTYVWGQVSKFRTNSSWNKVSANQKGNPSKLKWNSLLDDEHIFKRGNQQKRNPSFAAEKQRIGNPSNSALRQDDDGTTPNQSTRGYPITQKFDRQPRYETQHT